MDDLQLALLTKWESFYVIVGSSGAALTGLQFVVIALIADSDTRKSRNAIAAFGTPTIVYFCAVLLVSAIMSAPWRSLTSVSWTIAIFGFMGVLYGLVIVQRARKQTGYRPVFEDWMWFAILPLLADTMLLASGIWMQRNTQSALFLTAATSLMFLFVGIHNAWDSVTYIALKSSPDEGTPRAASKTNS